MTDSALRLLVDVGVGAAVERVLAELGHDVLSVRAIDVGMADRDIARLAEAEGRVLITMDKDFGDLVHRGGETPKGVLLLRMEDATGDEKAKVVSAILEEHGPLLEGAFSVYQSGRLRIRSKAG